MKKCEKCHNTGFVAVGERGLRCGQCSGDDSKIFLELTPVELDAVCDAMHALLVHEGSGDMLSFNQTQELAERIYAAATSRKLYGVDTDGQQDLKTTGKSESRREAPHMEMDDITASFESMADANNSLTLKLKHLEARLIVLEGKQ